MKKHKPYHWLVQTMKKPYTILSLFIFTFTVSQSAFSWTQKEGVIVFNSSRVIYGTIPFFAGSCIKVDVRIDHKVPDLIFSRNYASATTWAYSPFCQSTIKNQYAATRIQIQRWNGVTWVVCKDSDYKYGYTGENPRPAATPGVYPFGVEQFVQYGDGDSCSGPGYYGAMAYGYVWDGSKWNGGNAWSGYEYVP